MPKKKQPPVRMVLRPREGFTDFANRLETVVHVGGNTFGAKRKPIHEESR
jgi:hypothetical protein